MLVESELMDTVFVRTRHAYRSYYDYWRLVELSGYPTCYVEQIDLCREVMYVISPANLEFLTHIEKERTRLSERGLRKNAHLVWWNLERPDNGSWGFADLSGAMVANSTNDVLRYCDTVWVSDRYFQSLETNAVHVVLGGHPGLSRRIRVQYPYYQWCHMSQVNDRRKGVLKNLKNYMMGPNAYGTLKERVISHSKLMLNVHQTEMPIMEPLRFALAAAYKMPVISETIIDPWPLTVDLDYISAPYGQLSEVAIKCFDRADLGDFGFRLHEKLCLEWTFRRGVDEGIAKTLDLVGRKT